MHAIKVVIQLLVLKEVLLETFVLDVQKADSYTEIWTFLGEISPTKENFCIVYTLTLDGSREL